MTQTQEGANPGSAFGLALRRVEKNKINNCWLAFRNSVAVALPLGIGMAFGNPLGAVAVTTGALNVSFSDGTDPYGQRARRMLVWSVFGAVAVFVGSVVGRHPLAAVVVALVWAFIAGMLIAISTRARCWLEHVGGADCVRGTRRRDSRRRFLHRSSGFRRRPFANGVGGAFLAGSPLRAGTPAR